MTSQLDTAKALVNSRIVSGSPGSITATKLNSTLVALIDAVVADRVPANIPTSVSAPLAGADLAAVLTSLASTLSGKADLASPTFTGVPAAPTAATAVSSTQIATTAFVQNVVAALIDNSPGALDTLNELAAALGDDANFATTMTDALAGKQPLDSDLTAIAALATTSYGRALLTLADQAALQTAVGFSGAASGSVIASVRASLATFSSVTAIIPVDDTIPQNTEGTELLTVSITPTNAASKLRIRGHLPFAMNGTSTAVGALFRDSGADAIGATFKTNSFINLASLMTFDKEVAAGSTSATTFKLRAGVLSGAFTLYVNGASSRLGGGVVETSLTIEEIKA